MKVNRINCVHRIYAIVYILNVGLEAYLHTKIKSLITSLGTIRLFYIAKKHNRCGQYELNTAVTSN